MTTIAFMKFDPDFHTIIIILQRYGHPFICGLNIIDCGEADIGKLSIFIFEASFFANASFKVIFKCRRFLLRLTNLQDKTGKKEGAGLSVLPEPSR